MEVISINGEEIIFSVQKNDETIFRIVGNQETKQLDFQKVINGTAVASTALPIQLSVELARAILTWNQKTEATEKG